MRLGKIVKSLRIVGSTMLAEFFGGLLLNGQQGGILTTITYSPVMVPDAGLGNEFVFTITDNVAFQLSTPINPPPTGWDQVMQVTYRNTSGGAHGAGAFAAIYKVSGNFAAVATGNQRTIAFRWNGTNWVEIWRTAADVAV